MAANWKFWNRDSPVFQTPLTTEDCEGSDEDSNEAGEPDMSSECQKLWDAAMESRNDFDVWTKVLEYSEKETNLMTKRRIFDAFLLRFPYCYVYWKKYADLEERFKENAKVEQVYSRALQAFPHSVDLWVHFLRFLKNNLDASLPETVERLRGTFKEAVDSAGLDFRSDRLWEMYAQWEKRLKNYKETVNIYDQVLTIPTQIYNQHFERFKDLVRTVPPQECLTTEEFQSIRSNIVEEEKENSQVPDEDTGTCDDAENEETDFELQKKIREQIIKSRKKLYLHNVAEVGERWAFEEAITRPYFHAMPLNPDLLENWRKYLEFEISKGQQKRIVMLYERCLVACAHYEEIWLSYARYMETISLQETSSIFQRACQIHLPQKANLYLQWASFEEKHGQIEVARVILGELENQIPGLAVVRLKRVGVERRSGNLDQAEQLLQGAVEKSIGSDLAAFFSVKLARFLQKVRGESWRAIEVLTKALEREPNNSRLHLCLLEIATSRDDDEAESSTLHCVERSLQSCLSDDVKKVISQRRLEFLEDCGSDFNSLLSAYNEHQKLLEKLEEPKDEEAAKASESTVAENPSETSSVQRSPLLPIPPYPSGQMMPPSYRPPAPTNTYAYNAWYQNYNAMSWETHRYYYPH
uniref:Pre-mRNA-processing factor 39 n=1 Tax=Leptobrachium leishanense TaxID=445787 RepID=A0A8C5R658_9ANUR